MFYILIVFICLGLFCGASVFQVWAWSSDGSDERHLAVDAFCRLFHRKLRPFRCRHDGFLGRGWRRRGSIEAGYQRDGEQWNAETYNKPLQGFGFFRLLFCRRLVIVQQWTNRTMQVSDPCISNAATLP